MKSTAADFNLVVLQMLQPRTNANTDKIPRQRDSDEVAISHSRLLLVRAQQILPHYYSITSSARASSVGGTSMPSVLAVLRFSTSSNLVACSTGRSPGLIPCRTLCT